MQIIGYTYDADFHCLRHSLEHWGVHPEGPAQVFFRPEYDSEGNEVRAVHEGDEFDSLPTCPECLEEFLAGKIEEIPAPAVTVLATE